MKAYAKLPLVLRSLATIGAFAIYIASYPTNAHALWPGDCGKPTAGGTLGDTTDPVASDALYVLRTGVGTNKCSVLICDVDGNGKVSAVDALFVLRASVGTFDSYACPSCWTTGSTPRKTCKNSPQTDCTANAALCSTNADCVNACVLSISDFEAKLNQGLESGTNADIFTDKASDVVLAIIDSQTDVTWTASNATWTGETRKIKANNIWIHGATYHPDGDPTLVRPRVTIAPQVLCYHNASHDDEDESENNSDQCPTSPASQAHANASFLDFGEVVSNVLIGGNGGGIIGLGVTGFFEGVHFAGKDSTLLRMRFDRQCDESFSSESTALGSEVRDSLFRRGCGRCVEDLRGAAIAGCTAGRCYHSAYFNVNFEGCGRSIRIPENSGDDAKVNLTNTEDTPLLYACSNDHSVECSVNAECGSGNTCSHLLQTCSNDRNDSCDSNADCGQQPCDTAWPCYGPTMLGNNVLSDLSGIIIDGCAEGLTLKGGTYTLKNSSYIINNLERGMRLDGTGTLTATNSDISWNGGMDTANGDEGGILALGNLEPNFGSSATAGNNCIRGNARFVSSTNIDALDISNSVPTLDLKAKYAFWGGAGGTPAADRFLLHCSGDPSRECTTNSQCNFGTCTGASYCAGGTSIPCTTNGQCGVNGLCRKRCSQSNVVECSDNTDCGKTCNSIDTNGALGAAPSYCSAP